MSRRFARRGICLGALLTVELLALSFAFDTAGLSARAEWQARLAGDSPAFLRVALAFLGALLLLLAPRFAALTGEASRHPGADQWLRPALLHLAAFAGFAWSTARVFGAADSGVAPAPGLVALWVVFGSAVALTGLLVLAGTGFWRAFLARERGAIGIAAAAGMVAWLFGLLSQALWQPLATTTFRASRWLLGVVYPETVGDVTRLILGTPGFMVRIDASCSGYEGLGLITVFLAVYLWMFRAEFRFPSALLLFPIGLFAMWLANTMRIVILIAIGSSVSPAVALGGFHSQAGWIAFIAISLLLIVALHRWQPFGATSLQDAPDDGNPFATALLLPALTLIAGGMLAAATSAGFDRWYTLKIAAVAVILWTCRDTYRRWVQWPSVRAVLLGVAVFVLWIVLEPSHSAAGTPQALASLADAEALLWIASRVCGSVLIVPLAEELAFRGYFLRRLSASEFDANAALRFTWPSVLLSSLAFGLLHGRWFAGTLAGMAFALAYYQRGRIIDAVAAHVTCNALIAIAVLGFGQWSLWI